MTRFTELDLVAAAHESAHVAAAALLGLTVDFVTIDRDTIDGWGETHTSFRHDDPRTILEKAAARAVVALAGVLWEPGTDVRSSDGDVHSAYAMAEIAGVEDPDLWVEERSRTATQMLRSERFRAVADAVSFALLEEGQLSSEQLLELIVSSQLV